ncbi:ATP-dependent DNA helicase RecG [uncultured Muribaculum sp.]|uniref:ATP-dependent DNA helicase RecG n=1 Tax=uncultured Muribaculum sp. TaxID=1918613 RepID=UPI0025E385E7|nr:ATP-dependent DNA helicase RecG [uncultured Muribaculum sp.]
MEKLRNSNVMYLRGIGPRRAELLDKQLGIRSYRDLLYHFPTRYVDRSMMYRVADFDGDMPMVQVRGRFITMNEQGDGAKRRLVGLFTDGTQMMEVVWFRRIKQIREAYHLDTEYVLFGKPEVFNNRWSMVHPEIDTPQSLTAAQGLRGVYSLTEKLTAQGIGTRQLFGWVQNVLAATPVIRETLPQSIIARLRLPGLREALADIHNPASNERLQAARLRLKFEELFYLQLDILRYSRRRNASIGGFRFSRVGDYFNRFYFEQLPFPLTGAQKRVIKEIRADMGSGRQMNRLLQGDVGSGKTLVALLTMLIALDNGYQACLMAPTEILATQHYATLSELVAPLGVNVRLLTGSTRKKERDVIHEQLLDGSLHILVGTHAVIEDNVCFRNLGFVVIDEQHRFGVAQRARLWGKNSCVPHVLVMTATPIPRTLAMTVYGDLSVSVIDELPPGRKPVTTLLRYEENREQVYRSVGRELAAGRQVYVVYPLIQENEKLDLQCLEEGYERICETFPSYKSSFVHGRMKPAAKEYQMSQFASGEARILVATTVIEVGVNVPNASVMIIENAERFGLSQLHQLRGRVGRGAAQSFCILMSKRKISGDTRKRLEVMTSTTDGFVIAEADMKMRGPGDIEGTMQSGLAFDLKIADLARDGQIVELARREAEALLEADPTFSSPDNAVIAKELSANTSRKVDWSRIS